MSPLARVIILHCLPAVACLLLVEFTPGCSRSSKEDDGTANAQQFTGRRLELFVGSASQPPTEDAARLFEERTGADIEVHFGGSGAMLSQMKLAGRGDIYFPGSSDYMELAKREGDVDPETEIRVAHLIPAINVPAGNPGGIRSLADLAGSSVRVGIARPDSVCVGLYAAEVLERTGLGERVRTNVVTHAESCAKTAQLVATGQVDAVLGWRVFHYWNPERIETVLLSPDQVPRIGYLPAAVSRYARDRELALAFLEFLTSPDGQAIYRRWHYLTTVEEARAFARPDTPVGGEWTLPESWR